MGSHTFELSANVLLGLTLVNLCLHVQPTWQSGIYVPIKERTHTVRTFQSF